MRGASFNNGVALSEGISFAFTRDVATRDALGVARGVDQPRFARRRLLCGAIPPHTVHFSPGGQCVLFRPGLSSDNTTPVWCVLSGSTLHLWSGTFTEGDPGHTLDISTASGGASPRASGVPAALAAAGATLDLFKQQPLIDGFDRECWSVRAVVVGFGLMALGCQVHVCPDPDDPTVAANWDGQYFGVVFHKVSDWLAAPGTAFFGRKRSDQLHTNSAGVIGAGSWALRVNDLVRNGTPPRKLIFTGCDYQNHPIGGSGGGAFGGVSFMVPAARSSNTSDDWTVDSALEYFRSGPRASSIHHHHATIAVRIGDDGVGLMTATGDGATNQGVVKAVIFSEGSTTGHDPAYRQDLSVPAGAVDWYRGTGSTSNAEFPTVPGWGGDGVCNGAIDADGAVTPGVDSNIAFPGNQAVGMGQCGMTGTFVCGADETSDGVLRATVTADMDEQHTYTALWSPQHVRAVPTSGVPVILTDGSTLFYISERDLTAPAGFIVNFARGTNYPVSILTSSMLWTPDGDVVQDIFAHGASTLHGSFYLAGRIYYGTGTDVRSIAEPAASRVIRPLQVATGGENHALAAFTVTDTTGGQSVQSDVAYGSAPAGLPAVDSTKCVIRITHDGQSSANCCLIRVGDVPEGTKVASLWFYVRNSPPAEHGQGVSQSLGLTYSVLVSRASNGADSSQSGLLLRQFVQSHGEWVPVQLLIPTEQLATFSGDDYRITLVVQINNGQAGPADLHWARGGLYACDPVSGYHASPYPMEPGATGADEVAELSGFSLPMDDDWTVVATCLLPLEPHWDEAHPVVHYKSDASLTSATTTTIAGGPATDYLTGGLLRIGTSANTGLTGVLITGYNPATKVITHEAVSGYASYPQTVAATVLKPFFDTNNGIDRPRELMAILDEDELEGVAVFVTTSRSLDGIDGHYCGMARITGGAVDWTTYIHGGDGNDWYQSGRVVNIAVVRRDGQLWITASCGGSVALLQRDFTVITSTFAGTEVLTKVRIGGYSGVTPTDWAYVSADEENGLEDAALLEGFRTLSFLPALAGGGGMRSLSIGIGLGVAGVQGGAAGGGVGP